MTVAIIALLVLGYLLVATESLNHINKAAITMFLGVALWCLYILNGPIYIASEYNIDFNSFSAVKKFIAHHIFIKYVLDACQVVLFFLGTMSIVEVLNGNKCFDFVSNFLRTNSSKKLLWSLALASYLISANLDNLTTATLMLVIMHTLVTGNKLRMIYGSIIVLAVNCGGLFTVIGDINSLTLWTKGCVTPTRYAAILFIPSLLMWAVPTWLVSRKLPEHLDRQTSFIPVLDENDAPLPAWQRLTMLLVGIGGLWFIPTFHRITEMPPFVGSFCVLGFLWIINELCNLKMQRSGKMVLRHSPVGLQYSNMQMLLFYIGLTLAVGVTTETGLLRDFAGWMENEVGNIYITATLWGALSIVMDNIAIILNNVYMYPTEGAEGHLAFVYGLDGIYWPILNYMVTFGGTLLTIGTMTGLALMKVESVSLGWYFRHITGKITAGGALGLIALIISTFLYL